MDNLFGPINLTLTVVKGNVTNYRHNIDDVYPLFNPTERIVHIVAPKKLGVFRFKTWPGFDPNYKPKNVKGRPPLPNKKLKHQDSLRATISFLVKSLDPTKKKDHTYGIKLDIFGQLNITGIVWMTRNPVRFDKYVTGCFNVFINYINKTLGPGHELTIDTQYFASLNIKSVMHSGEIFDRDNIFIVLSKKLEKYPVADKASLNRFVLHYIRTNERDFDILGDYSIHEFRYSIKAINAILETLNNECTKLRQCQILEKEFYGDLQIKVADHICSWIFEELKYNKCNVIQNITPKKGGGKGGVTLMINVGYKKGVMIVKKANIFKKSTYNSYCNTYTQGEYIHSIIEELFKKHHDQFVVSDRVFFEIID